MTVMPITEEMIAAGRAWEEKCRRESKEIGDAVFALWEIARRHADEEYAQTPLLKRIRALAHRLCEEKHVDPDVVVMGLADRGPMIGVRQTVAFCHPIRPQWVVFAQDADRIIKLAEEVP